MDLGLQIPSANSAYLSSDVKKTSAFRHKTKDIHFNKKIRVCERYPESKVRKSDLLKICTMMLVAVAVLSLLGLSLGKDVSFDFHLDTEIDSALCFCRTVCFPVRLLKWTKVTTLQSASTTVMRHPR
jgi:hypothetical protein